MTHSLISKLLIIVLALCSMGAASRDDVIGKVLDSKSKTELYGTSNPTIDDLRYVWSISDKLIEIILKDAGNDRAWRALHRFRNYTDAGLTVMYYDSCFVAIKKDPLIFYHRYMSGDEKSLQRAKDAVWGNDNYEENRNVRIESNVAVLKKSAKLISKISDDSAKHKKYLIEFKKSLSEMMDELGYKPAHLK